MEVNSRGSKDILRFRQDSRPQEWRQIFQRDELDAATETCFEQLEQREKVVVSLGARRELNQEIDFAVGAGFAARDGTVQRETLNTQRADLPFRCDQTPTVCSRVSEVIPIETNVAS
jgi:hypothetical protein